MMTADYQLKFEDRNDYLYVHISGQDSFRASLQYWNEIADKITRLGHRKLLVHEALDGQVRIRDLYALIMDLKHSSLKDVKIAFHDDNPAGSFINRAGKLIAAFSGANVRVFSRLDAARRWIEQAG